MPYFILWYRWYSHIDKTATAKHYIVLFWSLFTTSMCHRSQFILFTFSISQLKPCNICLNIMRKFSIFVLRFDVGNNDRHFRTAKDCPETCSAWLWKYIRFSSCYHHYREHSISTNTYPWSDRGSAVQFSGPFPPLQRPHNSAHTSDHSNWWRTKFPNCSSNFCFPNGNCCQNLRLVTRTLSSRCHRTDSVHLSFPAAKFHRSAGIHVALWCCRDR